jgi:NTE family protein
VPHLERQVGLFDTQAMPHLVDVGRRTAEAQLPAIMALLQEGSQLAAA